jgi:hypothetical protein
MSAVVDQITLVGRMVTLEPLALAHVPKLVVAACEDRSSFEVARLDSKSDGYSAVVLSSAGRRPK